MPYSLKPQTKCIIILCYMAYYTYMSSLLKKTLYIICKQFEWISIALKRLIVVCHCCQHLFKQHLHINLVYNIFTHIGQNNLTLIFNQSPSPYSWPQVKYLSSKSSQFSCKLFTLVWSLTHSSATSYKHQNVSRACPKGEIIVFQSKFERTQLFCN